MKKVISSIAIVSLLGQIIYAWRENVLALTLAAQVHETQLLDFFPTEASSTCATFTPFTFTATRLPSVPATPRLKTIAQFYQGDYASVSHAPNFDEALAPFFRLTAQALQSKCVTLATHYQALPLAAQLFNTLGTAHLAQNHISAARAYYELAWQLAPTNAPTLETLIFMAMRTSDMTSEAKFLASYLALPTVPHDTKWQLQQGRLYELRGQWRAALQTYQTQCLSAECHYRAGEVYKTLGDLPNAQKEFETTLAQDPQFLLAWGSLNFVLLNQKKYEAVNLHLQQLRQTLPQSELADLYEGWNALLLNQPNAAILPLQKATARNPQNALAWELLGQAYLQTKQPLLAAQAFEADVKTNPFSSQAFAYWGYALLEAGQTTLGCAKVKEAKTLGTSALIQEVEKKFGACP